MGVKNLLDNWDKEDSVESNGFPTKRNHAGNQQNYVPEGENGGEYTYDGATIKPGEELSDQPIKQKEKTKESEDHIAVKEGDGNPINKGFQEYIDSKNFRQDFKEQLRKDYSLGDDDSRATLERFISDGNISIERTSGEDCCEMRGILKISKQSEKENRVPGEVFWHESYHGIDFQSLKNIPNDKLKNIQYSNFMSAAFGLASATASTRYLTSNGKTVLETLTEEITSSKRDKKWGNIYKDFRDDLEGRLKDKYPDLDSQKASTLSQEETKKIWAQVDKEMPQLDWKDPEYHDNSGARYRRIRELTDQNETLKRIHDYMRDRNLIEHELFKEWGSISDMHVAGGGVNFCGGHSFSYFRKDKALKALEFFAEYGSARATNDKPTLDKFKKYFPETSKAAEEVLSAIHKYSKKGKKA